MSLRPCPECGAPRRGDSCGHCGWAHRSTKVGVTYVEKQRRAAAVAEHRRVHGNVCPGWQRDPHESDDLTADHVDAVALGGGQAGELQVLCRACNGAKGAAEGMYRTGAGGGGAW